MVTRDALLAFASERHKWPVPATAIFIIFKILLILYFYFKFGITSICENYRSSLFSHPIIAALRNSVYSNT